MVTVSEIQFRKCFGEIIRKHRIEEHLSQEELADRSHLHRTYISEIERGLKTVSLLSLFRISKALRLNAHSLIKEIEENCSKIF
jgi:transcriptional regulator with XRE-family HTH domain